MKKAYPDSQEISTTKRAKFTIPIQQDWNHEADMAYARNEMEQKSSSSPPLGLKLRKSPSLLDLIQSNLCQKSIMMQKESNSEDVYNLTMKETGGVQKARSAKKTSAAQEKKKATNFSALVLKIGAWEYGSRYEGDLVAKCYFSKRKLVWEVLEGGLKSKIEIQWPDITGLKAICPQDENSTLEIELSRPPMFFRESNPQPRKHTIWQATSDFTGGQAAIYKRHLLQFPKGQLEKHYQSLIQSDPKLNMLSKKGLANTNSPFFDTRFPPFRDQESLYLQLLNEDLLHVLPHPACNTSTEYYLPPLTSIAETTQTMVPQSEHVEPEEIFSGSCSISSGEDTASWSSKKKILDELANFLLGDGMDHHHHDKSIIDRVNSNLHSLRPRDFHELQKRIGSYDY